MSTPIVSGFHPDPSVCFDGEAYYVATSSFEYSPGVPIHRSTDLLTWELVGNALDRDTQLPPGAGQPSSGIYAPTLRFHGGRYWLATTNIDTVQQGHLIVHAERPEGPWSDPVYTPGALGIDPDLCWDEDGICRLTWASFHPAMHGIASVPIDPTTGTLLGEPCLLWGGTGMASAEGPHLYRIDGWWYLMLAEGGTERGHAETIARARTLDGPWEECPHNPILTHRSTKHPVQNTGHADLVRRPDGTWAMVYLGVRPHGQTPRFHLNGRETFLAGIDWVDGWPVVVEDRFEVPAADHSFVDDFTDSVLHPRWVAPGVAPTHLVTRDDAGRLCLAADDDAPGRPLLTRTRDRSWAAAATFDVAHGTAGLELRIDEHHRYGLIASAGGVEAYVTIGPAYGVLATVPTPDSSVTLAIRARATTGESPMQSPPEPDVVDLVLIGADGSEQVLATADGRYLSTEVAGGFTGRMVGARAHRGSVAVEEFRYTTLA